MTTTSRSALPPAVAFTAGSAPTDKDPQPEANGSSMTGELVFSGEIPYSNGIKFIAYLGDRWIVNRITRDALQNFFWSGTTPDDYLWTFACYRHHVVRLARSRIQQRDTNEWGGADITSEYLQKIQYQTPEVCRTSRFDASLGLQGVADRVGLFTCSLHHRKAAVAVVSEDRITVRGCCFNVLDTVESYLARTASH
jgi:hypothetical protein